MTVEIFTLCEATEIQNGSLTLERTFDSWSVPHFPARIAPFFLVTRLRFPPEIFETEITVRIRAPGNGGLIHEVSHRLSIPHNLPRGSSWIVLRFENISIQSPGIYSAELWKREERLASLPVFVNSDAAVPRQVLVAGTN